NALRELPQGQLPSLLRALVPTGTRRTAATTERTGTPGAGGLTERLARVGAEERARVLEDLVVTCAASVLGHASATAVEPDRPFKDLGFDSLTAVELRNRLRSATGLRLPATLVFDHPTPVAIARFLDAGLFPEGGSGLPDQGAEADAAPYTGGAPAVSSEDIDAMDLDNLISLALDGNDA
ncbi:acyl carrier protein, partial [Kitasatospora sp. NPDC092286]|uniref:acyl carrier protein n=1 Tax=Kitasatospora sp. NPDC092286 TaxID=3364087 RepID=UPI003829BD22